MTVGTSGVSNPNKAQNELHLFPNPISGTSQINIQGIKEVDLNHKALIQVYDVTGMLIVKDNINLSKENKIEIDIQTPGLYVVSLIGNKNSYRGMIVIQ